MNMDTLQPQIDIVMQLLGDWWGDNLTWDAISQTIQASRGKILRVEMLRLPTAVQGFCAGLRDCDVIGLRKSLDQDRLQFVKLHEAAHLLLQHVPILSFGEETREYSEYNLSRCDEWINRLGLKYRKSQFTDQAEREADDLAYRLLSRVSARQLSPAIKHFYII
jgi:Zn-dependent peptidase ImmA (M78 family)